MDYICFQISILEKSHKISALINKFPYNLRHISYHNLQLNFQLKLKKEGKYICSNLATELNKKKAFYKETH